MASWCLERHYPNDAVGSRMCLNNPCCWPMHWWTVLITDDYELVFLDLDRRRKPFGSWLQGRKILQVPPFPQLLVQFLNVMPPRESIDGNLSIISIRNCLQCRSSQEMPGCQRFEIRWVVTQGNERPRIQTGLNLTQEGLHIVVRKSVFSKNTNEMLLGGMDSGLPQTAEVRRLWRIKMPSNLIFVALLSYSVLVIFAVH